MNRLVLFFNILLFSLMFSLQAGASFSETSRRYLSTKDMFTLTTQKFPVLADPNAAKNLDTSCWVIGSRNVNITGLVNPALGLPATTQPGAGFVRWWGSCGERIVKAQFEELTTRAMDEKLWRRFWNLELLDRVRDANKPAEPFHKVNTMKWTALSDKMRDNQIRYLVEEMIGPNAVVKDLGFVKGTDELADLLRSTLGGRPTMTVKEANQQLILALVLREEFVTY